MTASWRHVESRTALADVTAERDRYRAALEHIATAALDGEG